MDTEIPKRNLLFDDAIEVLADLNQQQHFDDILKVQSCYTVTNYVSIYARNVNKVVDHNASLRIGLKARFIPLTDVDIPRYCFSFATHEMLKTYREHQQVKYIGLTDYIGRLEKKFSQNTSKGEKLKKFVIQDEWKKEVEITFWKDMEHLATDDIREGDIIVITSTTSSKYRVEQLETTRATTLHVNPTFHEFKEKVAILKALPPLQTNVTIHQMLNSNPGNKYSNYKCIA
ncbi:uncharacterized protein LOC143554661 [Bidens hawaiensis]|uniref:uncharacterized protein LOC143554661 n=1 Tax=Bidens hawaiensis TaxID=980011 RepID=UPI004049E685